MLFIFLSIQTCLQRGLIKMFNFFLQSCWTKASYSLSYVIHLINLYCNKPGDTTKPQCCSKPNLSSISTTRKVFRSKSHTVCQETEVVSLTSKEGHQISVTPLQTKALSAQQGAGPQPQLHQSRPTALSRFPMGGWDVSCPVFLSSRLPACCCEDEVRGCTGCPSLGCGTQ